MWTLHPRGHIGLIRRKSTSLHDWLIAFLVLIVVGFCLCGIFYVWFEIHDRSVRKPPHPVMLQWFIDRVGPDVRAMSSRFPRLTRPLRKP